MTTKSFSGVRVKDADRGIVEGVFATFDVIDRDGDVHRKGCFTTGAPVVVSAYGHTSWEGALPVGKGVIREQGNEAIFEAQFFLDIPHAKATFDVVKALSEDDLQEWSYSLYEVEGERGTFQGKSVRFINRVGLVKEVSPTLMGAGVNTRTLAVKGADMKQLAGTVARMLGEAGCARWERSYSSYVYLDDFDIDASTAVFCVTDFSVEPRERYRVQVDFSRTDTSVTLGDVETEVEYTTVYLPKSSKFSDHADAALCAVKGVVDLAVERLALRAAEGKSTVEQTSAYEQLVAELAPLKSAIDSTRSHPSDDATREFLRAVKHIQGVAS